MRLGSIFVVFLSYFVQPRELNLVYQYERRRYVKCGNPKNVKTLTKMK